MKKLSFFFITALLVMYSGVMANASILNFDSQADYLAELAALGYVDQQTVNFESRPAGTTIPSGGAVGGVTFTYSISSEQIAVHDNFSTTSPFNYIGLDNSDGAFVFGDSFTMTFDRVIHAVGLYVIAEPATILAGDFILQTDAGNAANSAGRDQVLSDGEAFFIGLIATDFSLGFSDATLAAAFMPGAGEDFLFNVDDITSAVNPVPLPGALTLLGSGLMVFFAIRRKYNRLSS